MPGYTLPLTESRIIADLLKRQRGTSVALAGGAAGVEADEQEWTVASTPATTYTLRSIPLDKAVWLYLNGVSLREGTDYTCDYSTGVVTVNTSAQPLTADDVLWARWITTGDLAAGSSGGVLVQDVYNTTATTTLSLAPLATGDLVVVFIGGSTAATETVSGLGCTWSKQQAQSWTTNGAAMWVGYGGGPSSGTTITTSTALGIHALVFRGTLGDASAIVASSSSTPTGDIRTEPMTPTVAPTITVGYLVTGDNLITSAPAWTSVPSGAWQSFNQSTVFNGSFSGGAYSQALEVGTTGYRSTGVNSGSFAYARFGLVLQ